MTLKSCIALAAFSFAAVALTAAAPAAAAPVAPEVLEKTFDPFDAARWRGFDWAGVETLPAWTDAPGDVFQPGEESYSAEIAMHVAKTLFLGRLANLTLDRTKWPSAERRMGVSLIGALPGDCGEALRRMQAAYGAPAASRSFSTRSARLSRSETDQQWTAGATTLTLECVEWRTGPALGPGWRVVRVIFEPAAIAWPVVPRRAFTCRGEGAAAPPPLSLVLDEREQLASTSDDRMLGLARFSPARVRFEARDARSGEVIAYDMDRATGSFTATSPQRPDFHGRCRPDEDPGAI